MVNGEKGKHNYEPNVRPHEPWALRFAVGITALMYLTGSTVDGAQPTFPGTTPMPVPASASATPGPTSVETSTPSQQPTASSSAEATPADTGCKEGIPVRFVWPELGVDAPVVKVGYDDGSDGTHRLNADGEVNALGTPDDNNVIGWFQYGRKPGQPVTSAADKGAPIFVGHTLRNGTGVMKPWFSDWVIELNKKQATSQFYVIQDNGSECRYGVDEGWVVAKLGAFSVLVTEKDLYGSNKGTEAATFVTCSTKKLAGGASAVVRGEPVEG